MMITPENKEIEMNKFLDTKNVEAERLADLIDVENPVYQHDVNCAKAAAELRLLKVAAW